VILWSAGDKVPQGADSIMKMSCDCFKYS